VDATGPAADLKGRSPVRLEGEGLVLREWTEADVPLMADLLDDPDIALRTPLPSPFTLGDALARLAQSRRPDRLLLAVTTDGATPLGEVLLTASGELGYMVGSAHRRRGLALRAVGLLRDHAHDAVGLPVLRLRIEPDNHPSIALARRAGFRPSAAAPESVENKGRRSTVQVWEHRRGEGPAAGRG
jgi:RimJ/RimL family protein N-acetyltransferase